MIPTSLSRRLGLAAASAALLCISGVAQAQVLISQEGALAGIPAIGDSPGFPITIGKSGSYKLSSDLTVTDPTKPGIVIAVSDVTIDLNGHTISGPLYCVNGGSWPGSCTGGNPGLNWVWGIDASMGAVLSARTIRNGTIRGFSGGGISLSNVRIEDMNIYSNGGDGIVASDGMLLRVNVFNNLGWGINLQGYSSVIDSLVTTNTRGGMKLANTVLKRGNLVSNNNYYQIYGGSSAGSSGNVCNNVAC